MSASRHFGATDHIVATPQAMNFIDYDDWEEDPYAQSKSLEEAPKKPRSEAVSDDSIQLYLREIGQIALLCADEELTLAKQITQAQQAQRALLAEVYDSWTERTKLEHLCQIGDDARRILIQANLRLVVSVAKKYIGGSLTLMDLVQEGNIGLMRAIEKFDYRKGHRFSTYATWWIRQAVSRALAEQGRVIRLPVHLSESIAQLRRVVYQLGQNLERDPSPEEIAEALGVSVRKVKRLLQASTQPISLEQPMGSEGEGTISELLTDEHIQSPVEVVTQHMLHQELREALMELPERERTILELRYGLVDGQQRTLEEVGSTFGITRERTRQIEAEALRHLRQPRIGGHLQSYLE